MTVASRRTIKRLIVACGLGAAALGTVPATSHAADLGPLYERGDRYVRTARPFRTWRERCAYAGYYCLYAEYGYVYHYPFDDRPYSPRHRFLYR